MMGKKMGLRLIAVLAAAAILLCSVTGCAGGKGAIEERLQDFVVKCNELDIDGILRCIDPSIAEPIALTISGIKLVGKWSGNDIDKYDIYDKIITVLTGESGLDAADFFESIEVEPVKIRKRGKLADVYSNITYAIADIKFTKEGVIYMNRQADVWYIEGLEFGTFD